MATFSRFLVVTLFLALFAAGTQAAEVVVDNDGGAPGYTETGGWSTSGSAGYNGGTYRFANVGDAATATWTASLPEAGDYEVFVWYVPGSNRTTAAKYVITAADQAHTVYVNQTGGGYTWESLGTFPFNVGDYSITLDVAGSTGGSVVIADAVRFGDDGSEPPTPPVPVEVAPGVWHAEWLLPAPQVINVVEFDLADRQYTIEMGFAKGKRHYDAKEKTSAIADRYDTTTHDVVAAVNCAYFEADIGIHGMLGTLSNLIGTRTDAAWVAQTYMLQGSGAGAGCSDIPAVVGTAQFEGGATLSVDVLNLYCGENTLALYTPDWDTTTGSTSAGVEVIVEHANYPLRPNKLLEGVITAVRTGAGSINNAIPAGGFVLHACPGAESALLAHAVVGQSVAVRFVMQPAELNNAQMLCTGNAYMVKDGVPFQGGGPERHPRTIIAWSGTRHWFVTFDGRQPGYAVGASVAEMQDFLINSLHVENAINLDGGGSTTMIVNDVLVNCPSDGATTPCTGTERLVPNALLLVRRSATTGSPLADPFAASGRALNWDDKFSPNPVVPFTPAAPGSDGYVMELMNPAGGYETASVGGCGDADTTAEATIYCEYRPEVAADGFERVGLFARDDGNANFESADLGGGNCYALTYDTDTGRIRAGVVVGGVFTDFLAADPLYEPMTGWHRFGLDCYGTTIRYYLNGGIVAEVIDTTLASGRFGAGHHEYFATDANVHGAHVEDFRAFTVDFDYDNDGDVDWADFNVFRYCFQGPGVTYAPGHLCAREDGDGDFDVDLADYGRFQPRFGH